ncbi:nucleotidyltransferase domain-containing protein [Pontibacter anaerobius]|uniref:Nucleotidyltransferase family protein n=1 Tax=Pontibacter anaerobius TaxID=2993940 RepID=A0ABT3RBU9_9BACT|nr:hypothetical protein [Pontibacter anaerobius]MCX2738903.1 hypothetical protein [Pontibacter anaerobius]
MSDSNDDLSYWLSQPAEARLAAVQQLRAQYSILVQMELTQDFQEVIKQLNAAKAEYLIAGGFAVAVYGYPRYTGDIDIWINPTEDNAQKVLAVLYELGYDPQEVNLEDLTTEDVVVQLGYPPNRIDLSTGLSGVDFETCWQNKAAMPFGDVVANFISLKDLKKNKQATARQQDLLDLENLPR